MDKHLLVLVSVLVLGLAAPVCAQDTGPYYALDEWLAREKSLTRGDIELRNCQAGQTVFDTRTQGQDHGKEVCEVWTLERTIPAEPLRYRDGQIAMTTRKGFSHEVPRTVQTEAEILVTQDSQEVHEDILRYIVRSGGN